MKERLAFYFKKFPVFSYAGVLLFFVLIEGLYSFCTTPSSRPIDCPAFHDPNFEAWFPYQSNQKFYLISNLGKKDSVIITSVTRSPAFTGSGSCNANAQVWSADGRPGGSVIYVNYNYDPSGNFLNMVFFELITNGTLQANSFTPFAGSGTTAAFHSGINLNNKSFSNVIEVQRDTITNKQPGTYKFWLAKNTGFIAFERYPTREQWVKE